MGKAMNAKQTRQEKLQAQYSADFLAFYQAYPKDRHQGYVKPFQSWERLRKKGVLPPIDVIISAIEHQKTTRQWLSGYIPMMTTWLNQQRWEAAIEENSIQKEAKRKRTSELDEETKKIREERFAEREEEISRIKYNSSKMHSYDLELVGSIAQFFIFRGNTIYFPNVMFPFESCISDVITDLLMLRTKGETSTELGWLNEYTTTLILALFCRHSDSFSIDALVQLPVADKENSILNKILPALAIPDLCAAYRSKYSYKTFVPIEEWAAVVDVFDVLNMFRNR